MLVFDPNIGEVVWKNNNNGMTHFNLYIQKKLHHIATEI